MKRILCIFLFFSYFFTFIGCKAKPYTIPYHAGFIELDGQDTDSIWKLCDSFSDFKSPWDSIPDQGTQFKAFYNEEYLFFHFRVKDSKLICYEHELNDIAVEYSDRVELFFAIDSSMSKYCGLEFDACGRKMQFFSTGYRQFEKRWEFPDLKKEDHVSKVIRGGYAVEGRLSMKSLRRLGMIRNNELIMGVFRADCLETERIEQIRWVSWKDINLAKPDFHIIQGFRKVKLGGK